MTRVVSAVAVLALVFATPAAAQDSAASTRPDIGVEIVITRGIADRMPVDTATTFQADIGRVACWTRVTGAAGSAIQHVWIHDGQEFVVPMQIGGSPWRTWSTKEMQPDWTGEWRVEVRDSLGTVLSSASFTVAPVAAAQQAAERPANPVPPLDR